MIAAGAAFVGREAELGVLGARLEAARGGLPQVVLVAGPPGIGKTALVARFLAGAVDARVLWASGDESEGVVAFGVADQLLRAAGRVLPAGTDHIAAGLGLLELLDGCAPTVVVVDDCHWADAESMRALLFAARRLVAEPLVLVLVTRDEAPERLPEGLRKLAGAALRPDPLGACEIVALASALDVPLSAAGARRLARHTGGSPLHVRALLEERPPGGTPPVRELLEEHPSAGALPLHDLLAGEASSTRAVAAGDLDLGGAAFAVPRSYGGLIAARLRTCEPETRALVEAAAVLGTRCPLGLAAAVAGLVAPLAALDGALEAGLLELAEPDDARAIRFPHPLARAAVYHALTPAGRAQRHLAAAERIEDEGAALRHRVAAAPGEDATLAATAEAFAGRELARGAWASAVASLRAASGLSTTRAERERRMLDAIDATMYAGDGATARRLAEEAADFAAGPRRDSVLAYLAFYTGDVAEAERRLRHAWEACDARADPDLAATIAQRRAFLEGNRFRGAAALEWAERALALRPQDQKTDALASTQRAVALSLLGRPAAARAALDACLGRIGEGTGFPMEAVKGAMLLHAGDLAGARRVLRVAAAAAQRIGSLVIAAQSHALLAKVEFAAGEWDDAVVSADRAVSLAGETDEIWVQAFAAWAAQHVPLARGEAAPVDLPRPSGPGFERVNEVLALAEAERARTPEAVLHALAPVAGAPRGHWRWEPQFAEALVSVGRLDEADRFLRAQEARGPGGGAGGEWRGPDGAAGGEARGPDGAAGGEWRGPDIAAAGEARGPDGGAAGEAGGREDGGARPETAALLASVRARLEAAAGRPKAAEAAFEAALAGLSQPYPRALTELAYGRFLRRERRRRAATMQLAAARERLSALGALPALEQCERELDACGHAPIPRGAPAAQLTPQERAVAQLVASGLSNRRVAAELLVSVRTVETHLTRVYAKLGVGSRAELAARGRVA